MLMVTSIRYPLAEILGISVSHRTNTFDSEFIYFLLLTKKSHVSIDRKEGRCRQFKCCYRSLLCRRYFFKLFSSLGERSPILYNFYYIKA